MIRRNADGTREASSWEEFARWAKEVFKGDGEGICVLSEASSSPSLADMRARLKKALPKAEWFEYEPSGDVGFSLGDAVLLHDAMFSDRMPSHGVLDLAEAKVIVAIDADLFGGGDPLAIKYARDFAAGRRLHGAGWRDEPALRGRVGPQHHGRLRRPPPRRAAERDCPISRDNWPGARRRRGYAAAEFDSGIDRRLSSSSRRT